MTVIKFLAILILTFAIKAPISFGDKHANRLLRDLLNHYNIYERPILNSSEQVVVYFGMGLRQLVSLVSLTLFVLLDNAEMSQINFQDERSQTIETIIFFKYVSAIRTSA